MDWVKFLGTAGARFVVARQLRHSAGIWLELSGTQLLLDPGPGTLLRCRKVRPALEPTELSGLILSHKHLDHSTDVNIMIEAMADGGLKRHGILFAPEDALEGDDPVVLRYVRPFLERIEVLKEGQIHQVGEIRLKPVRHSHSQVETYGLVFEAATGRLGFVVDTRFIRDLPEKYSGCDLLVLNVVLKEWNPKIDHLSLPEALEFVKVVKPKLAVLTHFGMTMLRGRPWKLAAEATEKLGIKIIAAEDGMSVSAQDWRCQDARRKGETDL